jgi:hypothetical protein
LYRETTPDHGPAAHRHADAGFAEVIVQPRELLVRRGALQRDDVNFPPLTPMEAPAWIAIVTTGIRYLSGATSARTAKPWE